jgi:hypothetical protein
MPDRLAILCGEAAADSLAGQGPERPTSAKVLRSAANGKMTKAGMLPDGVTVNRGATHKGALPHLF